MDKYTKVKLIGKGNMGTCTLARNNDDGKYYVIKQVDLTRMSKKDRQQSLNEARVLSSLRHPNIINYIDSFLARKSDNLCIVMEYAESGDVSTRLKKNCGVSVPEAQVLDWFIQLVLSLDYVHQRKILHRDVKTQNIFLTHENLIKLGDFGISRTLANTYDQAQTFVGTPYYLSPELILEQPYDYRSDVWALGVVLYELLTLKHPFNAKDMKGLLQRILSVQYDPIPTLYSAELRDIVSRMLVREPAGRIKLDHILQLPIIRNRIYEWLGQNDTLPQHYVRSLCKHHLLPAFIDGAPAMPSARSAARAAAAMAQEEYRNSTETTSGQTNTNAGVHEDSGSQSLGSPNGRYPSSSSTAQGAADGRVLSADSGPRDRGHPFIPSLKPYNMPPQLSVTPPQLGAPPLTSPSQRAQSNSKPHISPPLKQIFSSPNPIRPVAQQVYRQQSEPMCQPAPPPLPSQRNGACARPFGKPYPRPYVAHPFSSASPGYLLMANPRRNPTDMRRQPASRPPGLHLNPLYHAPRQVPSGYRPLAPAVPVQSDIKAMLHRAAAERARRRQEFT